jgi:hypothetical protein
MQYCLIRLNKKELNGSKTEELLFCCPIEHKGDGGVLKKGFSCKIAEVEIL